MTPASVGVFKTKIILGRHSGRHGLKSRLLELGYKLDETELQVIYEKFLELADKKKEVFDDDLRVLMGDTILDAKKERYSLEYIHVTMGTNSIPTGTVKIKVGEDYIQESATGDGAVDACFNAIERALNLKSTVESYNVRSITSGRQAMGEVIVRIRENDKSFTGRRIATDVIEASAKAYIQALNQQQAYLEEKENDETLKHSLSDLTEAV
jgi:2-isopropylmalate synthase